MYVMAGIAVRVGLALVESGVAAEHGDGVGAGDGNVVCTNMVGGFIGNNLGSASNLKLLDENANVDTIMIAMLTNIGIFLSFPVASFNVLRYAAFFISLIKRNPDRRAP